MTNYEFNKLGYAGLISMSKESIQNAKNKILKNFLFKHMNEFYMLLNNDIRYYTIFQYENQICVDDMADEIIDIVTALGEVKEITLDETGDAIEFWVMYEGECHMFLLFDYTRGVVKV